MRIYNRMGIRAKTFLILLSLLAASLAGCLDLEKRDDIPSNNGESEPCEVYPDRALLREKWGGSVNETKEGYDAVGVGVARWGNLEVGEQPKLYVDWEKYPVEKRPELFTDVLCFSLWRIENIDTLSDRFSSTVFTSNEMAVNELERIQREHVRQTGKTGWSPDGDGDGCCYIVFEGHVFGVGCRGIHQTWPDGSSSRSECTWDDS